MPFLALPSFTKRNAICAPSTKAALAASTHSWSFTEAYPWLDIPTLPANWRKQQHRGIVDACPGLYLLGKDKIFAAASEPLPGVVRDARYLAKQLAATRAPEDATGVRIGQAA